MRGRLGAWVLFLLCLLLLSLAATPYSKTADLALMSLRLALVAVLSILVVRERWKHQDDAQGSDPRPHPDGGDRFLQRLRRWYYDDEKPSN